ncbi:MAG: gliding motility-associated C-terminal domain-containing protein [Saprospiraceae bacterium]|nr:gliding motility-associated C-terminal domain-containing protein [Saprospiraceae bacterium]
MRIRFTFLAILWLAVIGFVEAQPSNDNCLNAIELTDLDNWCSVTGQYTTVNGTQSPELIPSCFPMEAFRDIWFRFTAQATDLNVTVIGDVLNAPGGSLQFPELAVYSGDCGALVELQCSSDAFGQNVTGTLVSGLLPGSDYYIRVAARNDIEGSFQLCVNNYNLIPDPESDCPDGVVLCDKSSFNVSQLVGAGELLNEVDGTCIGQEFSSVWYKWTCDDPGSLTFTLTPDNPTDDLDFAVFEMNNGIDDCSNLTLLRCMASGENVGSPFSQWAACTGPTGLSLGSTDTQEVAGCQAGDDNFVAAINMEVGKTYLLIVNNFSNTGFGFSIEFGGSGTFLGPSPDFTFDPPTGVECDNDIITFTDNSIIPPGFTATYEWSFGAGASPATASGPGPHQVMYSSFGNKGVLLQITTEEGCIVNDVQELFIESCCDPATDLQIALEELVNPICFGDPTGYFVVSASGGTPNYQFSVDDIVYQSSGNFFQQTAGNYTVYLQDIKGCRDSLEVVLVDPEPLTVDAGPDQTVDLGFTANLLGLVTPVGSLVEWLWQPGGSLDCIDCPNPVALPPGTTTYYVDVIDDLGCRAVDSMTVFVDLIRPIYVPNAFSPNFDGVNDNFTIFGNPAAVEIKVLRIFSRWGELIFESYNFPLNDPKLGWDGSFRGEAMGTGVYTFFAEISFLDGVDGIYEGGIHLIR